MAKYTQKGTGHLCVSVMKAARSGPTYGLMTMSDLIKTSPVSLHV